MIPSLTAVYLSLLTLFSLSRYALAQQYLGERFKNNLTEVVGAEIAYWNIVDKKDRNLTLVNYVSTNSFGRRLDPKKVQRLILMLHGDARDPFRYMTAALTSLNLLPKKAGGPSMDNVQIIAPLFPNGENKGEAYPWTDGLPPGEGSTSSALVWKGARWSQVLFRKLLDEKDCNANRFRVKTTSTRKAKRLRLHTTAWTKS